MTPELNHATGKPEDSGIVKAAQATITAQQHNERVGEVMARLQFVMSMGGASINVQTDDTDELADTIIFKVNESDTTNYRMTVVLPDGPSQEYVGIPGSITNVALNPALAWDTENGWFVDAVDVQMATL